MSKAAVLGATGVIGTGGAALVGAHQLGAFGGSDNYMISTTTAQLTSYNGQCFDKTFGKDKWEIPGDTPEASSKISFGIYGTDWAPTGCLAFNWDKKEKEEGKWGGDFRFVWTTHKGTLGFAVYLSGTTTNVQDGKVEMEFEGVAYYFSGAGLGNGRKKALQKLTIKNQKAKYTLDELSNKFPVLNETLLKGKNGVDGHLNFLDSTGKKIKPVGPGESAGGYARWVFKEGTDDSVNPWKNNTMNQWWSHFFDQSKWDISNTLGSNVKGKWELETMSR